MFRGDGTQLLSQQPSSSRRIALVAIYATIVLVAGYILAFIPNIELVTCLLFVGGIVLGLGWAQ